MDFMDFNDDGKTETGEQFVGYQIFQDVTGGGGQEEQQFNVSRGGKLDGFDVFILIY